MIIKNGKKVIRILSGGKNIKNVYKRGHLVYVKDTPVLSYLTFTARESGTFGINFNNAPSNICPSIDYSTDNGTTWNTIANDGGSHAPISLNTGEKVMWRGPNNTGYFDIDDDANAKFISSGEFDISGNIMSLLSGYADGTAALSSYCFNGIFSGCEVVNASGLELPATTLTAGCYYSMFQNCTSLTSAPSLPATTLAAGCYAGMFSDCTSLTSAPSLPATTLATDCYNAMFQGCRSLTSAPSLPATTLTAGCYSLMFYNCTSLTSAPSLPATTLANNCYSFMFYCCTSLTSAPSTLPATTLATSCYYYMFCLCTSLTVAPSLPATTLANHCYSLMFASCSQLNYIKAMFTTQPGSNYTYNWVTNVAQSGTFVKNANATWTDTGVNAVPSGWTIIEES